MKFVITEKQDVNSTRKGIEIEVADLAAAKRRAAREQMFQGTVLTIEDQAGNLLAVKHGGKWDNRKPTSGHNTEIGAAPVLDKNIIIVNDGNFRWGADREELEAAMRVLGWEQEGRYWVEPEGSEDEPGARYTELCDLVSPLPGMDSANNDWQEPEEGAWDDLPTLTWAPNVSRRHWLMIE